MYKAVMRSLTSDTPKPRRKMVHWYDPLLLIRTGVRSLLATSVGQITDNRELHEASKAAAAGIYDYSDDPDLWFDFVADIGDGFESTHAIATCLASPTLSVIETATQAPHELPRAKVLVCGGDLVYPDPSIATYLGATFGPYQEACQQFDPTPGSKADFYALPGNHDWYDGLQAFEDLICYDDADAPRWPFGHWRKPQTHSYFSLQLPHQWWLLGIDFQLDGRINPSQRQYFERVISKMSPDDRCIVCVATPYWTAAEASNEADSVDWINHLCAAQGARVALILTGDLHHYSRYGAAPTKPALNSTLTLVTAGGGGAFLHPTHSLPDTGRIAFTEPPHNRAAASPTSEERRVELANAFPSKSRSRWLLLHNLKFPILNWEISLLAGFVYTLLAWTLETRFITGESTLADRFQFILASHSTVASELARLFAAIPQSPEFALIVILALGALVSFNGQSSPQQQWALGITHTLFHLLGLCITYCLAIEITIWFEEHLMDLGFAFLWLLATMLVLGGGVGGVVFGVFLIVSSLLFNANVTNAFSSIRLASYKNFVRLHFMSDGSLALYALGLREPALGPAGVHLIEKVVLHPPAQASNRGKDALE